MAATPKRRLHSVAQLKKREAFLAAYAECGNVSLACIESGLPRRTHYEWLRVDLEYAQRFQDAQNVAVDALEAEARRRALDGVDEPVGWYQGTAGGTVKKYSDTLLIFLLKAARPEKYKERHDIRVGPLERLVTMDDDALARLEAASDEEVLRELGEGDA